MQRLKKNQPSIGFIICRIVSECVERLVAATIKKNSEIVKRRLFAG